MTDDKIALRAPLKKGSETMFLREVIGFAVECLMQVEINTLCGTGAHERSTCRINKRDGYRDGTGRPRPALWSCASQSYPAVTTLCASSNRAACQLHNDCRWEPRRNLSNDAAASRAKMGHDPELGVDCFAKRWAVASHAAARYIAMVHHWGETH